MTTYGLTPNGLVIMRQSDIISQQQAQIQAAFGQNINFAAQALFGQLSGISSERLALLWEQLEAVYTSQYPSGAEGTSVDNILALSGLRRLPAAPTKTAPTNTNGVNGLVLYGTPGTVVPVNSIISMQGNSSIQFTLDSAVTILAAVNAVQIILLTASPTSGNFTFQILDASGNILTSPSLPWNTPTNTTQVAWNIPPASGNFKLTLTNALGTYTTPSRPYSVSAATLQADIRALNALFGAVTVTGGTTATVLTTTGNVSNGSTGLTALASTAGLFPGMAISGANIPANTYIASISGASLVMSAPATGTASGETVTFSGGLAINWGAISQPTVAFNSNTLDQTGAIYNSLQSVFNTFEDTYTNLYPYTDVTCTGSLVGTSVAVNFGTGTVLTGEPSSGAQPQNAIDVTVDGLMVGSTVVNMAVLTTGVGTATGAPSQGIGSATCTATGPTVVPAGYLTVIGSPISGWTSVTNPLDCVTGSNVESDTAALARRENDLAVNANGPLQAIAEKVSLVPGVVQAVPFQNLSVAALQILNFSAVPTSGGFTLAFNGGTGLQTTGTISWQAFANVQALYFSAVPSGGSFTITMDALTTAAIPYTANAAAVQAAIHALGSTFTNAVVTGSFSAGFFFSFGAGAVQQYPISTTDSLTGATITAVPSVQAMVNALTSYGPATVQGSFAASMVVAFNGSTGGQAQNITYAPTNTLEIGLTPIAITPGYGRPGKSFEIVVSDNNGEASNTAIAEAIYNTAPAGILSYGNQTPVPISDTFGNTYLINFSRPTQVTFYVVLNLVTDLTTSANPQFNVGSILTIQEDIAAAGNAFPVGGLVVGFGSNGLVGAFNNVAGITSYTLYFGTSPNPSTNSNVQLLPEQVANFETFAIIVSYQ
jgi:hypothetical protein